MRKLLGNVKGFSLTEMMVVSAIIGILSMIAVPNVMLFRTRAIQKEGMALLSTLYGNMRITRAQIEIYPRDFVAAGYRPEGELSYNIRIGSFAQAVPALYPDIWVCDARCFGTDQLNCQIRVVNDGCGVGDPARGDYTAWTNSPNAAIPTIALCDPETNDTDFLACAGGNIGGNQMSVISINQAKSLIIVQDGTTL